MEDLFLINKSPESDGGNDVPKATLAAVKKKKVGTNISSKKQGVLMVDVFQTDDEIVIKSMVAGVASENLDISVTSDMVTVRGMREADKDVRESDYYYRELYWGLFSKSIILPVDVDADKAQAQIKNGILTIRLPKIEKAKTRRLKIS